MTARNFGSPFQDVVHRVPELHFASLLKLWKFHNYIGKLQNSDVHQRAVSSNNPYEKCMLISEWKIRNN